MRTIAVYNIKGGVGKTAAVVNLAYLCAQGGTRTLIWDLDPQGAATFYLRVKPRVRGGATKLIAGKRDLAELIKATDFAGLDLLPADFSYRHMDLELEGEHKPERRLAQLLKPLKAAYDVVFLDCPPSISLVSENVFHAAELLLVPTIPTTLSLRTYVQLKVFLDDIEASRRPRLLPFFSQVDGRKALHQETLRQAPQDHPEFLVPRIPYLSEIERMGVERRPLVSYGAQGPACKAYQALWEAVQQHW